MARIKYTGRADVRVLDADDLKKADVEGFRKTSFARGEAVEVDDAVATLLTDSESFDVFGKFEAVSEDEPAEDTGAKPTKGTSTKPTKSGAASNNPGTAPTGPTGASTGA